MKRAITSLILFLLFVGLATSVDAWQIEIGDAYDVSGYYAYDIAFSGDATDNLSLVCLSVGYDTDDVSFTTVAFQDYNDGALPVANDTWVGGGLPYTNDTDNGLVYGIMGEEPLGTSDVFYPVATDQTLLFTVYFQAADGATVDDSSVYFVYGDDLNVLAADGIEVNGNYYVDHELTITTNSIAVPAPVSISLIQDQTTNIDTPTAPIAFTVTPTSSGSINITGSSSNTALVPDDNIAFFTDDQGTCLTNPLAVSAGVPVTLYLTATPTGGEPGTAEITISVTDAADTTKSASTDFELSVELAEATLNTYGGKTSYTNTMPVTLSGEKARGSRILLSVDGGEAFEIVGTEVDGAWSYEWEVGDDGTYTLTLINQAGSVSETIATGTLVLDTQPPVVPINERKLIHVSTAAYFTHDVAISASAPTGADSNRFRLCQDGQPYGIYADYDDSLTWNFVDDGEPHQAVPIPVDAAGNEQADCYGNPVEWQFDIDSEEVDWLDIELVEPETGPGYVQIRWDYDTNGGADLKLWAKTRSTDEYELLSGDQEKDENEQHWIFDDTAVPARIRSYKLTDPSGQTTLAEFQRLDDPSRQAQAQSIAAILLLLLD